MEQTKRNDSISTDLTKKENQTFKNWFKLQFKSGYILAFVVALVLIIGLLIKGPALLALFPLAICGVISYKGFYQYWDDKKKGITR